MKRVAFFFVAAAVVALASLHCGGPPAASRLCVKRAGQANAQEPTCTNGDVPPLLSDGEGFVVIHELAEDVDPADLELTIHVRTPCRSIDQKPIYYGRAAVALFVAPPGTSCALTVTSEVGDEHLRVTSPPPDAGACVGLDTVCKPAANEDRTGASDAGADASADG